MYHLLNKDTEAGLSITQEINAKMEWSLKAYIQSDYLQLTLDYFIKTIKYYGFIKFKVDSVISEFIIQTVTYSRLLFL
jgi:hypothetical protein